MMTLRRQARRTSFCLSCKSQTRGTGAWFRISTLDSACLRSVLENNNIIVFPFRLGGPWCDSQPSQPGSMQNWPLKPAVGVSDTIWLKKKKSSTSVPCGSKGSNRMSHTETKCTFMRPYERGQTEKYPGCMSSSGLKGNERERRGRGVALALKACTHLQMSTGSAGRNWEPVKTKYRPYFFAWNNKWEKTKNKKQKTSSSQDTWASCDYEKFNWDWDWTEFGY